MAASRPPYPPRDLLQINSSVWMEDDGEHNFSPKQTNKLLYII